MDFEHILERVIELIQNETGYFDITADLNLMRDLGLSPYEVAELLEYVNYYFGVNLTTNEIPLAEPVTPRVIAEAVYIYENIRQSEEAGAQTQP